MAASVRALGSVVILCVMMTSASRGHQGHSDYKHRERGPPSPCIVSHVGQSQLAMGFESSGTAITPWVASGVEGRKR